MASPRRARAVLGAFPIVVLCGLFGISSAPAANAQADPLETTICEINKNPAAYSGKTLRIRGFVSLGFEDFTFHSKECDRGTGIWLMYADDEAEMKYWARTPESGRKAIVYQGESYPLQKDKSYQTFSQLTKVSENNKPTYQVTATLTGVFFAQTTRRFPSGQLLPGPGYGHMGCCHLLIITSVSDVTPVRQSHSAISGIVVDSAGEPLQGVLVEGSVEGRMKNQVRATDKAGRFHFPEPDGDLTITKDGFFPLILPVDSTVREYKVTMKPLTQPDWIIPDCTASELQSERVGEHWKFQIPPGAQPIGFPKDWKSFKPLDLVSVPFGDDKEALMVRKSPLPDSLDIPYNLLGNLAEADFRWIRDARGRLVGADVRGTLDNGSHQRVATFLGFGDASYVEVSSDAASYFDGIISSACYARQ
ncbi:MAG TPA: carboxypeptidase-like regulatory domain-containing protein [Candidatus Acidoferrales bacterium]|jgi:hypothetical protein|nr:carboxypeptidase-like regulatory domain-containing protein [Candidatus Acidoferrales bacterium]